MKKNNVTIQAIADALGISRNTVSKVMNGHDVPHQTKEQVVKKAIDMGYKGFNQIKAIEETKPLKLLLLTGKPLSNLDFFLSIIRGIESSIQRYDIDFFQYTVNTTTTTDQLENYIQSLNIDGIIGIELYDRKYLNQVLHIGTPIVFIDSMTSSTPLIGNYDIVLMESSQNIYKLASKMIAEGAKSFGFVGDPDHCLGFYERYLGMREALYKHKIHLDEKKCILEPDESPYGDVNWLMQKLAHMDHIPEVFFCANDSIAIPLTEALKKLYKRVPQDVQVVGFDNTIEAALNHPSLTTIDIDKEQLGQEVIHTLLQRIKRATIPNRTIYLKTKTIYRQTTK